MIETNEERLKAENAKLREWLGTDVTQLIFRTQEDLASAKRTIKRLEAPLEEMFATQIKEHERMEKELLAARSEVHALRVALGTRHLGICSKQMGPVADCGVCRNNFPSMIDLFHKTAEDLFNANKLIEHWQKQWTKMAEERDALRVREEDWHKVADARSVEIVRLERLMSRLTLDLDLAKEGVDPEAAGRYGKKLAEHLFERETLKARIALAREALVLIAQEGCSCDLESPDDMAEGDPDPDERCYPHKAQDVIWLLDGVKAKKP